MCSVQFNSVAQLRLTLCNPMDCSTPGLPVHHELPEFTQTHVHWVGDAIQPPQVDISVVYFSSCLQFFPASGSFQDPGSWKESWILTPCKPILPIGWPKYWSLSISPSNEYSGLISFRFDWLDLIAVQGTLKSLHQQHSSKALTLQHSTFFIVQLSHPHMTTGKIIAFTRWTYVAK